jgi:hypothetical protein
MNEWSDTSRLAKSRPLGVSRAGGIRTGLETQFFGQKDYSKVVVTNPLPAVRTLLISCQSDGHAQP